MNIHELIRSRSSIRKYKNAPVPLETVMRLIESACRAPSSANMQCWRFIIIDDEVQKRRIAKTCPQDIIAKACEDAPYVVVLCVDPRKSSFKNNIDYFLFDCALAMENFLLAACGEGLSTCVVAWYDAKEVTRILELPSEFLVIALTPLGYADEEIKPTARKPLSEVVFRNRWGKSVF